MAEKQIFDNQITTGKENKYIGDPEGRLDRAYGEYVWLK
jgi:hypothetical protein